MKITHNIKLLLLLPLTLVLLLALLLVYTNIKRLGNAHHTAGHAQHQDLLTITAAAHFSQALGEVQQHMNAALQDIINGQSKLQLHHQHNHIVNKMDELATTAKFLSESQQSVDLGHDSIQGLLNAFADYQRFVIMTIDVLAIDPHAAEEFLHKAQQHYVSFSILSSHIQNQLAERALFVNKQHETDFTRLMQDTLLISLGVLLAVFIIALFTARRASGNMLDLADALRALAQNQENHIELPRIEYLHQRSDGELKQITGKLLDFRNALQRQREAEEKAFQLAFYDPLTLLPNRRLLDERLQQTLRASLSHSRFSALLVLDLDSFKHINNRHGHKAGDQLLIEIANRLSSAVKDQNTVARIGGNAFSVLLPALQSSQDKAASEALQLGERLCDLVGQPLILNDEPLLISACCGITLFDASTHDSRQPLKQAEAAMYNAKTDGRGQIHFFDAELQRQQESQSALENDLRWALELNQLVLFYQLQVDASGKPQGVEALLRWQHPQRGMVSPGEFIPLAESSDLILPIGDWVLKTACRQLNIWSQHPHHAKLSISVNVSARQFCQENFVARVQQLLEDTGAPAQNLKLEVTESLAIEVLELTVGKMQTLRDLGVHLSLDDFGTGYSSLQYLQRMPLDQLKIEQSFARNLMHDNSTAAIVQAIIAMGDALSIEVIAEGVETQAQWELLYRLGCRFYQGYLFSKPAPLNELEQLLQTIQ